MITANFTLSSFLGKTWSTLLIGLLAFAALVFMKNRFTKPKR